MKRKRYFSQTAQRSSFQLKSGSKATPLLDIPPPRPSNSQKKSTKGVSRAHRKHTLLKSSNLTIFKRVKKNKTRKLLASREPEAPYKYEEFDLLDLEKKLGITTRMKQTKPHELLSSVLGEDITLLVEDIEASLPPHATILPPLKPSHPSIPLSPNTSPSLSPSFASMAPSLAMPSPSLASRSLSIDKISPVEKYIPPNLRKTRLPPLPTVLTASSSPSSSTSTKMETSPPAVFKQHCTGLINRVSEGNLSLILEAFLEAFKNTLKPAKPSPSSSSSLEVLCTFLVEKSISSAILTTSLALSLISVQTALICGLSVLIDTYIGKTYYLFLKTIFEKHFHHILSLEETHASNATLSTTFLLKEKTQCKNALLGICLLFSFGLLNFDCLMEILRKINDEKTVEFSFHLLLFAFRYTGKRFRQEHCVEFKEVLTSCLSAVDTRLSSCIETQEVEGSESTLRFLKKDFEDLKNNKFHFTALDRLQFLRTWLSTSPPFRSIQWEQCRITVSHPEEGMASPPTASPRGVHTQRFLSLSQHVLKTEDSQALWLLASKQKMHSDLQKSVFVAIMGAVDVQNAILRLLDICQHKMQIPTVTHVLLHVCLYESKYNPFYEQLALNLCRLPEIHSKRYKKAFQQLLISTLSHCAAFSARKLHHFAIFLSFLIRHAISSITLLRFLRFSDFISEKGNLTEPLSTFLLLVCVHILNGISLGETEAAIFDIFKSLSTYKDIYFYVKTCFSTLFETFQNKGSAAVYGLTVSVHTLQQLKDALELSEG